MLSREPGASRKHEPESIHRVAPSSSVGEPLADPLLKLCYLSWMHERFSGFWTQASGSAYFFNSRECRQHDRTLDDYAVSRAFTNVLNGQIEQLQDLVRRIGRVCLESL